MMMRRKVYTTRVTDENGYRYRYAGNKLIRKARDKQPEESLDHGKTWRKHIPF